MRASRGVLLLAVVFVGVACQNTLVYEPPEGCGAPGTICSLGVDGVGDGGPAIEASLLSPESIWADADGNIFVADRRQNRIRKISVSGVITTVAGNGRESYSDPVQGESTDVVVSAPSTVTSSPDGWVFWAEPTTCTIYGADPNGVVSVVSGGRCDASLGGNRVRTALFSFNECSQLTTDSRGNLVVADTGHAIVRYLNRGTTTVGVVGVTVSAGFVATIAGNGSSIPVTDGTAALANSVYPCKAQLVKGRLYVNEEVRNWVRRVETNGIIYVIVGGGGYGFGGDGGPARTSVMAAPEGFAVDPDERYLIVGDTYNYRLRIANLQPPPAMLTWGGLTIGTSAIRTIAGSGATEYLLTGSGAGLTLPFRSISPPVLLPNGNVVVADVGNDVLRVVDSVTGQMDVVAGYAGSGGLEGYLAEPSGLAVEPGGGVIVGSRNARLHRVSRGATEKIAGNGLAAASGDGGPALSAGLWSHGLAVDRATGSIFLADARNHRVRRIDADGVISTIAGTGAAGFGGDGGPAISATFQGPHAVALDSAGNLFVLDLDRVRFVNLGGATTRVAGIDVGPGNIQTIAGNGQPPGFAGDGGLATQARLAPQEWIIIGITPTFISEYPTGIAVGGGKLYLADHASDRIRVVDLGTGIIDTLVGGGAGLPGGVSRPLGLALHDGWLYWSELRSGLVRRMRLPSGTPETIAGDGRGAGYFGDGGAAVGAQLFAPQALGVSDDGVVYVSDGSHRVRQIRP